jgi:uncharacterized protein (DUF983 family)
MDEQIVIRAAEGETAVVPSPYWWRQGRPCQSPTPEAGNRCPTCGAGILAYDSLFFLTCTACGQTAESGAFT